MVKVKIEDREGVKGVFKEKKVCAFLAHVQNTKDSYSEGDRKKIEDWDITVDTANPNASP